MDERTRRKLKNRVRRAAGQLAAVDRTLDESDDCIALLHQLAAVEGALAKTRAALLTHHIESCVMDAVAAGDTSARDGMVDELMDIVGKQLSK